MIAKMFRKRDNRDSGSVLKPSLISLILNFFSFLQPDAVMEGEQAPELPEESSPAAAKRGRKKVEKEEAPKWDESEVVSSVETLNWDQILIDEDLSHGQVSPHGLRALTCLCL